MNEDLSAQVMLLSPLAAVGLGLLIAQVAGLALHRHGIPRLYGAVIAGLVLGVSGLGVLDAALLGQFQELFNAASALVLFDVGRKMDLGWLLRSGREGGALLLATVLRGVAAALCLALTGLAWGEACFIAAILVAVNPVIFASMTSDANASGTATFASANMVGLSNLVALVLLGIALAWTRSQAEASGLDFVTELLRQGGKLTLGILIAGFSYGLYALGTRLCRAQASLRPGVLLAALLIDLGLCSITASSALLSLLLMGLLLRNVEKRDNVFQAQLKTGQDIGYALLFLMSAALVDLGQLLHGMGLAVAALTFVVRTLVTRVALLPGQAWEAQKQHGMALSMCSLVSFGGLVVDSTLNNYTGLSDQASAVMAALLALNVLVAPGLTWWGLKLARETHLGTSGEQNE